MLSRWRFLIKFSLCSPFFYDILTTGFLVTVVKEPPSLPRNEKQGLAAFSLLLSSQDPQKKPVRYTRIGQKLSCEKRALTARKMCATL